MTISDRDTFIAYLQTLQADPYGSTLYNKMITGNACSDSLQENASLNFMIKVWYRYWAFPETLTTFQYITIDSITETDSSGVDIDVTINGTSIATYENTSSDIGTDDVVTGIVAAIESNSATTDTYAFEYDSGFIVWSYNTDWTVDDEVTITDSDSNTTYTVEYKDADDSDDAALILDQFNCISYCDLVSIYNYLCNNLTSC